MRYLLAYPPQVQFLRDGTAIFEPEPLRGATDGAKVFEALRRVRNDLFHGGKHTEHSTAERDRALLQHAITVLDAAADLDGGIAAINHSLD
jgi:hypothetical protein